MRLRHSVPIMSFFYWDYVMQQTENTPQDLMRTNYDNALLNWDVLLDIQTDLLFPFELQFFLGSEVWNNAEQVLDVGCGNGYYLTKLHTYFSDKKYTGIDKSGELIRLAKANALQGNIEFQCSDFFDYKSDKLFDAVLLRLTVQHMNGLEQMLSDAHRMTSGNSSMIIIEPDPGRAKNFPPTPLFWDTLDKIENASAQLNKNRGSIDQLGHNLRQAAGWELRGEEQVIVPQTGPFTNSSLLQMFLLWIDIFETSNAFQYDFDSVREELSTWARKETSYSQLALRIYLLEKK